MVSILSSLMLLFSTSAAATNTNTFGEERHHGSSNNNKHHSTILCFCHRGVWQIEASLQSILSQTAQELLLYYYNHYIYHNQHNILIGVTLLILYGIIYI